MPTNLNIDELLQQDEAALRAKRKRLKSLASAIEEVRRAHEQAAKIATELVDAGDLSRADLGRAFGLSKAERSAILPTNRASVAPSSVTSESVGDLGD
ncbi:MAG: hypothetical protein ACTIKT_07105 [Microbacterium sp.]